MPPRARAPDTPTSPIALLLPLIGQLVTILMRNPDLRPFVVSALVLLVGANIVLFHADRGYTSVAQVEHTQMDAAALLVSRGGRFPGDYPAGSGCTFTACVPEGRATSDDVGGVGTAWAISSARNIAQGRPPGRANGAGSIHVARAALCRQSDCLDPPRVPMRHGPHQEAGRCAYPRCRFVAVEWRATDRPHRHDRFVPGGPVRAGDVRHRPRLVGGQVVEPAPQPLPCRLHHVVRAGPGMPGRERAESMTGDDRRRRVCRDPL